MDQTSERNVSFKQTAAEQNWNKRSRSANLWLFEDIQSRNRKCTASQIYIMSAQDFTKNISLGAWLQEWQRLSVSQSVSQLLWSSKKKTQNVLDELQ